MSRKNTKWPRCEHCGQLIVDRKESNWINKLTPEQRSAIMSNLGKISAKKNVGRVYLTTEQAKINGRKGAAALASKRAAR